MNPPQSPQCSIIKTLDTKAQPIDASGKITIKTTILGSPRIGFQGDFSIRSKTQPRRNDLQKTVNRFRGE